MHFFKQSPFYRQNIYIMKHNKIVKARVID